MAITTDAAADIYYYYYCAARLLQGTNLKGSRQIETERERCTDTHRNESISVACEPELKGTN